jgi:predicted nucleic acid-binding protein
MAQDNSNHFILKRLYPNTESIITSKEISFEEIYKNALFVIDTNSLLAPYNSGKKDIEEIRKVYAKLIKEQRLFIPAHVLREFVRNRTNRISDLYTNIDNSLSTIPSIKKIEYPILAELEAYKEANKLVDDIKEILKDYKSRLEKLKVTISDWNWADPVSLMYSKTFNEAIVIDTDAEEESLIKEYDERIKNSIPPGNKDKAKGDNAIGDFLIWKSIIQLGTTKKRDVVFVTNDEKNDWVVKGNSKPISTRFELVDEFSRLTNGHNFVLVTFSHFLESQGVDVELKDTIGPGSILSVAGTSRHDIGESLHIIAELLTRFVSSYSEYVEDPEFEYHLTNFLTGRVDDFLSGFEVGADHLMSHYHILWSMLYDIRALNGRIEYIEARQKRNSQEETRQLRLKAYEFLKEYKYFKASIIKY